MRKLLLGVAVAGVLLVVALNGIFAVWPGLQAQWSDPRNKVIQAFVYYRWGVDPSTLVLDLWGVDQEASMADVDRVLWDVAENLQAAPLYSQVQLSFRGTARFLLAASYFRQLGSEREWQNPAYFMRTLPENTLELDGTHAFEQWSGGLLGVVGKQLQDHQELHKRWWLTDWAVAHS